MVNICIDAYPWIYTKQDNKYILQHNNNSQIDINNNNSNSNNNNNNNLLPIHTSNSQDKQIISGNNSSTIRLFETFGFDANIRQNDIIEELPSLVSCKV